MSAYVDRCIKTLRKAASVSEAASKLGTSTGYMREAFAAQGAGSPRTYLKSFAFPSDPPDPVKIRLEAVASKNEKKDRDRLIERLTHAEARAEFVDAVRQGKPLVIPKIRRKDVSGLREGTGVALLSDCHVEEVVRSESCAGRNEYNLKIADTRLTRFFQAVRWKQDFYRQNWTMRNLVLWLGGDLMTGYIHEELVETNELSPVETVLWLFERLKAGILFLLEDEKLERLVVPCNAGNHGRTTETRRIKTGPENSYEWLLYKLLEEEFSSEPRVTFVVPKSAHTYVDVYDFTLHFTHGDELKYGGGIGGLAIPLGKRLPKWDAVRRADYHHLGHFHSFQDLGNAVVNGSLIGYGDFPMSIGASFEEPQQAWYVLDAKRGKTCVSALWVNEDGPSAGKAA